MKKLLLILILLFPLLVSASDNRLYFTEEGNRLYYESKLIDENVFMKHLDMTPGKEYTDELIIENGTKTSYDLFFKVKPVEQSDKANTFLENLIMTITIDDNEIYSGKATGLDYGNGVDLTNAIELGVFSENKRSTMKVVTKLSEDYSDTAFDESSKIEWEFYASYENNKATIIVPNTEKNNIINHIWIVIVGLLIVFIGILFIKRKQKVN